MCGYDDANVHADPASLVLSGRVRGPGQVDRVQPGEAIEIFVHLKNGTPHSRYFSDELGVPIILIDTEQMFALQRDAWYNINVNIVYYLRKKNYFRR